MNGETNSFQYSNGVRTEEEQNTYEVERPTSPAGSDVTDVSFPMNVSDVDTDPPTVIHRPIKSNVESNRSAELHNEQQQIMQQPTKKITLDMDQNLLGSPMKVRKIIKYWNHSNLETWKSEQSKRKGFSKNL